MSNPNAEADVERASRDNVRPLVGTEKGEVNYEYGESRKLDA